MGSQRKVIYFNMRVYRHEPGRKNGRRNYKNEGKKESHVWEKILADWYCWNLMPKQEC